MRQMLFFLSLFVLDQGCHVPRTLSGMRGIDPVQMPPDLDGDLVSGLPRVWLGWMGSSGWE